jgi:hypothetical protein
MTINEKRRGSKVQLNQESTDYLDWFRAVIVPMVRRRIEEGATKYGELLPPEHDERDFGAEALEELVDAVFYVQRLEMQRRYLARENRRLMAKLAKVRADLEDTPDAQ